MRTNARTSTFRERLEENYFQYLKTCIFILIFIILRTIWYIICTLDCVIKKLNIRSFFLFHLNYIHSKTNEIIQQTEKANIKHHGNGNGKIFHILKCKIPRLNIHAALTTMRHVFQLLTKFVGVRRLHQICMSRNLRNDLLIIQSLSQW